MENKLATQWVLKNCRFAELTDEQTEQIVWENAGKFVQSIIGHLEAAKMLLANHQGFLASRREFKAATKATDFVIAMMEKLEKNVYPQEYKYPSRYPEEDSQIRKNRERIGEVPEFPKINRPPMSNVA
jgi:hypothetical protein